MELDEKWRDLFYETKEATGSRKDLLLEAQKGRPKVTGLDSWRKRRVGLRVGERSLLRSSGLCNGEG